MEIINGQNQVPFSGIRVGELFLFEGGEHIKTNTVSNAPNYIRYDSATVWIIGKLNSDTKVTILNAEIHIVT